MQMVNTTSHTFDQPLSRTGSEWNWIFLRCSLLCKVSLIAILPFLVVCIDGWRVCLSVAKSALPKTNSFSDHLDQYFLVFLNVFSLCKTVPFYFFAEVQPCTSPCNNNNDPLSLCINLCNLTTSYCLLVAHVVCVYNLLCRDFTVETSGIRWF